jgi:hypothetical protein
MAEFTEGDAQRAAHIVEGLLEETREGFDLQEGLSIIDVQRDSSQFNSDLRILSDIGADFPAIRVGDEGLVPISLSLIAGPAFRGEHLYWLPRYLYEFYYRALRAGEVLPGTERMPIEEARSTFTSRATDFLASRIAALRDRDGRLKGALEGPVLNILQRAGGPRTNVSGCSFSVSTNSAGLRVFWSGAYYITANYFGHPTTPTGSVLQSRIYIFGVDGGAYGNVVQWDTSAVCTLPGKPSVHLNF